MGKKIPDKTYNELVCVCMGEDCKKMSAKKIYKKLNKTLKAGSLKDDVLLIKSKCLDQCEHAPVIIVRNRIIGNVNSNEINIKEILK